MFSQQQFQKVATECFEMVPKNPEQAKELMNKVKIVYTKEAKKVSEVMEIYKKAATGDATANDLAVANKKLQAIGVASRFAALMTIPGAIFMIPALSHIELEIDQFDLLPDSVRQEFLAQ